MLKIEETITWNTFLDDEDGWVDADPRRHKQAIAKAQTLAYGAGYNHALYRYREILQEAGVALRLDEIEKIEADRKRRMLSGEGS